MKLCKKQKFLESRLQRPVAARNDVIAKRIAGGLFQNLSGRPEDWTVSGPCHLYFQVSVSAFMTKSLSRLEIWARSLSRSRRLRSRLHRCEKQLIRDQIRSERFASIYWTSTPNWVRNSTAVVFAALSAVEQQIDISIIFTNWSSKWTCSSSTSKSVKWFGGGRCGFTIRLKRLKPRAPVFGGPQNFRSKEKFQAFF